MIKFRVIYKAIGMEVDGKPFETVVRIFQVSTDGGKTWECVPEFLEDEIDTPQDNTTLSEL